MLNKQAMELIHSIYSQPKPEPRKRIETRTQGACGCTDFSTKDKPRPGLATRPPKALLE